MALRIKVCCIRSIDEARRALAAGADDLGLVSAMPSGPGVVDEAVIADVAAFVAAFDAAGSGAGVGVGTFLLTSLTRVDDIVAQHARTQTNTIQLCDALDDGDLATLRARLPGVRLVQVVHVEGRGAVDDARAVADRVDAVLLDSGRPSLAVKELGGTGRAHDWRVSADVVAAVAPTPVYLAGGLRADNVAAALAGVRPFGLDLCSGVRTGGDLDDDKLRRFIDAARAAVAPPRF